MTFRIRRLPAMPRTTFALSGELNGDQLAELGSLIALEGSAAVVLDMSDVTLVSREGVEFIQRTVAEGTELVNCPQYIRRWISEGQDEA